MEVILEYLTSPSLNFVAKCKRSYMYVSLIFQNGMELWNKLSVLDLLNYLHVRCLFLTIVIFYTLTDLTRTPHCRKKWNHGLMFCMLRIIFFCKIWFSVYIHISLSIADRKFTHRTMKYLPRHSNFPSIVHCRERDCRSWMADWYGGPVVSSLGISCSFSITPNTLGWQSRFFVIT